jgi:hypothetical protein
MKNSPPADGALQSASVLVLQRGFEPSTERYSERIAKRTRLVKRPKTNVKNTSMETTPEDNAMRRTHLAVAIVGIVFSFSGLVFYGPSVGLSILVGATVATANLIVLSRTVRAMVDGGGATWAGIALLKFLVLLAVTYGLIHYKLVGPLALAVGFGALPLGILLAGTFAAPRTDDPSQGGVGLGPSPAAVGPSPAAVGSSLHTTSKIESDHA